MSDIKLSGYPVAPPPNCKADAASGAAMAAIEPMAAKGTGPDKSFAEILATLPEPMQVLLASLEDYTFSLGDDVQRKELRLYVALKRLKTLLRLFCTRKTACSCFSMWTLLIRPTEVISFVHTLHR